MVNLDTIQEKIGYRFSDKNLLLLALLYADALPPEARGLKREGLKTNALQNGIQRILDGLPNAPKKKKGSAKDYLLHEAMKRAVAQLEKDIVQMPGLRSIDRSLMDSIAGAILLDDAQGGQENLEKFIRKYFPEIDAPGILERKLDPIAELKELCRQFGLPEPIYTPAHNRDHLPYPYSASITVGDRISSKSDGEDQEVVERTVISRAKREIVQRFGEKPNKTFTQRLASSETAAPSPAQPEQTDWQRLQSLCAEMGLSPDIHFQEKRQSALHERYTASIRLSAPVREALPHNVRLLPVTGNGNDLETARDDAAKKAFQLLEKSRVEQAVPMGRRGK